MTAAGHPEGSCISTHDPSAQSTNLISSWNTMPGTVILYAVHPANLDPRSKRSISIPSTASSRALHLAPASITYGFRMMVSCLSEAWRSRKTLSSPTTTPSPSNSALVPSLSISGTAEWTEAGAAGLLLRMLSSYSSSL